METQSCIQQIKFNGFVNVGQDVLTKEDVKELSSRAKNIFNNLNPNHCDYLKAGAGAGGVRCIVEHDFKLAEIANKIVTHPEIKKTLEAILGVDYKIWQINFRRSLPGDQGLQLHQDGKGQLNLCVLLDDNLNGDGATSFFSQTHLIRKRTKELKVELDPKLFKTVKFLIKPFSGHMGDLGIFLNRTWHGRFPNKTNIPHDILMIGFFPANTDYRLSEPYKIWSQEFLDSIKGSELFRLINPNIGTQKISEDVYRVLSTNNSESFAFRIENFKNEEHLKNNLKLRAGVAFLTNVMKAGRPFKRILRKIKGKMA
ncbi:MAG: phytanoyl-CoA dioxygenase family protein [Bacteriovorax sp.]|nr:phytanoyl-CoA dioxygenase family protein [Bacteriovorax sp.]